MKLDEEIKVKLHKVAIVFFVFALVIAFAPPTYAQHGRGMGAPGHAMPGPPPGPEEIVVPEKGASMAMQEFGGRPVVEVRINGKGPYRFILDTGARINVIDAGLNEELKLPAAEGIQAASGPGGAAPTIVSIREIQMGDATVRGVIGAVMPLSNLVGGSGPRGVLSASTFPGYLLTLDYPAEKVSLLKGKLEKDDARVFEYPSSDSLPTVPVRVAGRETRVHLDTGSGGGLTLPTRFMKELPFVAEPKETGKARTHSGEYPIYKAQVNGDVELGRHKLATSEVSFSDVRPGRGETATGQIGYEVLRFFVVTLDSRSRRIRFAH